MRTHYDNLKIRKTASNEDIRSAYRKLAQKWHPDKFTDKKEKERAERYFRIIKQAYDVLSDPACKRDYDDYLAANPEPVKDIAVHDFKAKPYRASKQDDEIDPFFFSVQFHLFAAFVVFAVIYFLFLVVMPYFGAIILFVLDSRIDSFGEVIGATKNSAMKISSYVIYGASFFSLFIFGALRYANYLNNREE